MTGLRSRAWRATQSEPQGEEHGPGWQDPFAATDSERLMYPPLAVGSGGSTT